MTHEHCDKCFLTNCPHASSCPLIFCPNGCFARMHECKRHDHDHICPNNSIPCLNAYYGCPLTIQRSELTRHLRVCPASVTVCSFTYNHDYHFDQLDESTADNLVQTVALRDNLWHEHMTEVKNKQAKQFSDLRQTKTKDNQKDKITRSEKYRYITMPGCMLNRGDGVLCSTCRKHLRQLEEDEDQRLAEMNEEERQQMMEFNDNYNEPSNLATIPSLVRMTSTLLNSSDVLEHDASSHSLDLASSDDLLPVVSDMDMPSSQIYRLNYFSSKPYSTGLNSFQKSPRFSCNALCRRDEVEQHWLVHFQIDCILNTSLIAQCPKSQYGCTFQYERLEPCRSNKDPIRIRFDKSNDAFAFDWYPAIAGEHTQKINLLNFPTELLEKILMNLDSLSLRNVSFVCRRLRGFCQQLLPSRGIVVAEYERHPLSHGDITWLERKKHWLYTNTTSAVPKWQLKERDGSTSLNQHMITCSYGEKKDLEKEPPFQLIGWTNREAERRFRKEEETND